MCTRILCETGTGTFIMGRGLDWNDPTAKTRIYAFPRGMEQYGGPDKNPLKWKSKYGSVFASLYDAANVDGMNEKGLVANNLYLAEADYGDISKATLPVLSVAAWAQYFLDNFATVAEAVEAMKNPGFVMTGPTLPNGRPASVHLSLSDPSGDSAILEYINGELQVSHSKDYIVMTNSPVYADQLAINRYWELIGGNRSVPGTINAADRFVRVTYLVKSSPKYKERAMATASVFSIMRAIGVPLGMGDPDHPNISATLWRTVADHDSKIFYFDSAMKPSVFWVDLNKIDFSEGGAPLAFAFDEGKELSGEVSAEFRPTKPIKWI